MDKINLGSTIPAYPMPVSLVGAHVDGKPNFHRVGNVGSPKWKGREENLIPPDSR